MGFDDKTKRMAYVASDGRCANCHSYPITNYHHIIPKAESMDDSYENCNPICSNCHAFIMRGEINPDEQSIIRDKWYRFVEWRNTPERKKELESQYEDSLKIKNIDENIVQLKSRFEDYITTLSEGKDPKEVELKASSLATAVYESGYTSTLYIGDLWSGAKKLLIELDEGETISGIICPYCKKEITTRKSGNGTIICPNCGSNLSN